MRAHALRHCEHLLHVLLVLPPPRRYPPAGKRIFVASTVLVLLDDLFRVAQVVQLPAAYGGSGKCVSPCLRRQAANSVDAAVCAAVGTEVAGPATTGLVDVDRDPTLATPGEAGPWPQAVATAARKSTATIGAARFLVEAATCHSVNLYSLRGNTGITSLT